MAEIKSGAKRQNVLTSCKDEKINFVKGVEEEKGSGGDPSGGREGLRNLRRKQQCRRKHERASPICGNVNHKVNQVEGG